MIPLELVYLLPFIMAALNRLRGTGFEDYGIKVPIIKNGAPIAGLALAGFFYLWTNDIMVAGAVLLTYLAGESFGWGKWLQTIPMIMRGVSQDDYNVSNVARRDTGKKNGIHAIASTISKEKKNYSAYAILALIIRGWYWWIPVFTALVILGVIDVFVAIPAVVLLGVVFPFCYFISYKINKKKYWRYGEIIYGFCQGIALAAVLT